MMSDTRDVQATGPDGLNADAALLAQVNDLSIPPTAHPLNITVIGQRWLWRFEYPGGRPGDRVFSYSELTVPVDTTVLLHFTSTDVTHRWFIPALGGPERMLTDMTTWFHAWMVSTYHQSMCSPAADSRDGAGSTW